MTEQCSCSSECESVSNDTAQAPSAEALTQKSYVSDYLVPKMDCPSEEGMIRMALESVEPGIILDFDTPHRKVRIFHSGQAALIEEKMSSLGLGAELKQSGAAEPADINRVQAALESGAQQEASILKWLLAINAFMFFVELTAGLLAQSTGLIADSLDMFADAAVYTLALYAVGKSIQKKLHAAHFSGWLQLLLALGALSEVIRRFIYGSEPVSSLMMGFGVMALAANVLCLVLISKSRDSGAHMKASWIFSANDVIANLGVIIAGALVAWSGSRYPDLVIGLIIAGVVLSGAFRILKLKS